MALVEGAGISRVSIPTNNPPYNIELRHGPAGTTGYGFSTTIAGSTVNWAEFYLPVADAYRYNGAPSDAATLSSVATDPGKPTDQRMAASALLNWAQLWRQYAGTGPVAPAPAVAPGVVAGNVTPVAQLPPLPSNAPVPTNASLTPTVATDAGIIPGTASPVTPGSIPTFDNQQRRWDENLSGAPGGLSGVTTSGSSSGGGGAQQTTPAGAGVAGVFAAVAGTLGITQGQARWVLGGAAVLLAALVALKLRRRRS